MGQCAWRAKLAVAPVRVGQTAVLHLEWRHAGHWINFVFFLRRCNRGHCAQSVLQKQGRLWFFGCLVSLAAGGWLWTHFVSLRSALTEIFLFNRDHDKIIDKHSTSNKNKYPKIYFPSIGFLSHSCISNLHNFSADLFFCQICSDS